MFKKKKRERFAPGDLIVSTSHIGDTILFSDPGIGNNDNNLLAGAPTELQIEIPVGVVLAVASKKYDHKKSGEQRIFVVLRDVDGIVTGWSWGGYFAKVA